MGCAFKRSCNGVAGALQEICGATGAAAAQSSCSVGGIVAGAASCNVTAGATSAAWRRL
jgi:hypothetical protein